MLDELFRSIIDFVPSLTQVMGLSWLFAEGFCLVYVRWIYLRLESSPGRSNRFFLLFCVMIFISLVGISFFIAFLSHQQLGLTGGKRVVLYLNSTFWRFLCAAWVVVEGLILWYIIRITALFPGHGASPVLSATVILSLSGFLMFYLYFEYLFGLFSFQDVLGLSKLVNLSRFFIKISGFMWIFYEWAVAIKGLQFLRFLRASARERI
ncbi:MAG TPA: hypothetical protein PLV56_01715 [Synergistales bacterium]|nr:hypothetical protein [Synergistales bacterium]